MIEIARTRYLLTMPSGISIEALEIALLDQYHDPEVKKNELENKVFHDLLNLLGHHRRAKRLSKAEIIVFETD